jgi:hypothetical protein
MDSDTTSKVARQLAAKGLNYFRNNFNKLPRYAKGLAGAGFGAAGIGAGIAGYNALQGGAPQGDKHLVGPGLGLDHNISATNRSLQEAPVSVDQIKAQW